jgi:hypothetical protein
MSSSSLGDSSLLLWLMAAVVVVLGAYLFIGWVRRAQDSEHWKQAIWPAVIAGTSIGVVIPSSMTLALAAEPLPFPLGYLWATVPALFLAPMVACIPVALWLTRRHNWLALIGGGLALTVIALAVQAGWLMSAGLRPGVHWQFELVGGAAAVTLLGFVAAVWLAYSDASGEGGRKSLWRAGAAGLIALTLVAGQEVMVSAAGLLGQVGSVYKREASSTLMCLIGGALVPTILAMAALDLTLRNSTDRKRSRRGVLLNIPKRRKRRRKYRAL